MAVVDPFNATLGIVPIVFQTGKALRLSRKMRVCRKWLSATELLCGGPQELNAGSSGLQLLLTSCDRINPIQNKDAILSHLPLP